MPFALEITPSGKRLPSGNRTLVVSPAARIERLKDAMMSDSLTARGKRIRDAPDELGFSSCGPLGWLRCTNVPYLVASSQNRRRKNYFHNLF